MTMSSGTNFSEKKGPISWMVHNPVAANLLMVLLLVGGWLSLKTIKQEVFPDFERDAVRVTVSYPGASPEEVERGIVLAVEEAVRGVDGVDEVISRAREGFGWVRIELLTGEDRQKVYQDIQQEVNRITTLPEEAEEPQVALAGRKITVISSVLYGDLPEKSLMTLAEKVREELLQDENITQVDLAGTKPYEISISVSQSSLKKYGLTLGEIAQQIDRSALELPAGGLRTKSGEILIRMQDRRDLGIDFEDIPIVSSVTGGSVRLGELADVVDGFEDTDDLFTHNGKQAVAMDVYRVGKQTPIGVSDAVRATIDDLQDDLPPGVGYAVLYDMAEVYRARAELLVRNGAIGLVLVLVLLGFFLETRLSFWVAMGIPISFLGTIMMLPAYDVSINMVSMFAFLIALGIVVDDAIVVGENIYEYHQRGMPFIEAAVTGAREVAVPVTFSVLTNMVTFLPLMFIPGVMGKIWRVIPAVVVTAFAFSLIECLFVLPAHLGHSANRQRGRFSQWVHEHQQRFSHWFSGLIQRRYAPFIEHVLNRRYLTVALGVGVLILTIGYVASNRLGIISMPKVEQDYAVVTAVLPYGSPVERSLEVRDRLLAAAHAVDDEFDNTLLEGISARIGASYNEVSGTHVIEIYAVLPPPDDRPITTQAFTEKWRRNAGRIPGIDALQFESDRGGPGSGAAITVELSHTDADMLQQAGTDLAAALALYGPVTDTYDGFAEGKEQLSFSMRPEGLSLGLTSASIAAQIRNAIYGAEALRQQRGRNEVTVKVRLPEDERVSEYDIEQFLIRTPAGTDVPLHEVATVERGRAYSSIERRDGRRTIAVKANVEPIKESSRILKEVEDRTLPALMDKYRGLSFGYEGRQADFADSMSVLKLGFSIAVIVIYALLAIPFRSYIQPLIIMVSIPFGIVGAVIGHMIMGYSISIMSMMGIVALSGVVVNDSLILIDFANRKRAEGASAHDAIASAGVRRFRPIMLTTLTTFLGLTPMIFETSMQARFMIPMAISLGFGILFATLITLVLVPSLYMIVNDIRSRVHKTA
jgi:multidrug efflux pump subunit AcrB